MQRVGDVMLGSGLMPSGKDEQTQVMVNWVWQLVNAYSENKSHDSLLELLAITTAGMRAIAFTSLPIGTREWYAFRDVVDEIAQYQSKGDGVYCSGQYWPVKDLAELEAKIERHEDGSVNVYFPVRYPWREEPDKSTGFAGIRDPAIFRSKADKDAIPDRLALAATAERPDKPWWMPENYEGPLVGDPTPSAPRPEFDVNPEDVDIPW